MKLYYAPKTRSNRPRWLLEELGVPFEIVTVDLEKGAHKQPDYLKVHPHGQVPALQDGPITLIESAAICMYLADKFPEKGLAPAVGTPERGLYYQWILYTIATVEPALGQIGQHTAFLPEGKRSPELAEEGRKRFAEAARHLEQWLTGKSYLLGEKFSAADVVIGTLLNWGRALGVLAEYPTLDAYASRLRDRPAFKKAYSS